MISDKTSDSIYGIRKKCLNLLNYATFGNGYKLSVYDQLL